MSDLKAVEAALRKNPLIAMFLDQGFWHAHHVDLMIRYNGEDKHFEADWIKDIWYAVRAPTKENAMTNDALRYAARLLHENRHTTGQPPWDGLDPHTQDSLVREVALYVAAAHPRADAPALATMRDDDLLCGDGYVYHSPDSGWEYAADHPIDSGECPDATDVRRSTEQEDFLHKEWLSAVDGAKAKNVPALVDRFLAWPLPNSVCADLCATERNYKHHRSGTNLLNANEARQMIEYLLAATHGAVAAHLEPSGMLDLRTCALMDQQYLMGARAAWNIANSDDPERHWAEFEAAHPMSDYVRVLKSTRAPAPNASAVADETEACARIAERPTYSGIGKLIAEAIRARLTPDKADGGTV